MNLDKLNDWLQVLAAVGVIAGLVLVAYELRQEHELVRAQLGGESVRAFEDINRSVQDETTSRAIARACESPLDMSTQDHVILDGFFNEVIVGVLAREVYMQERGMFEDDLQQYAAWVAEFIFVCEYGRAWYVENRDEIVPEHLPLLDRELDRYLEYDLMLRIKSIEERLPRRVEVQK
jgi:hypothetical protein